MPPLPSEQTSAPYLLALNPWLRVGDGTPEEDLAIRLDPGVSQRRPAARGGESATPERNAEVNAGFMDLMTPGPLDVAAAVAFGPGGVAARRLGAGAIAGLGMAGDAEGAWLNPRQIAHLWNPKIPDGQPSWMGNMIERAQRGSRPGLNNAVDFLNQQPGEFRLPLQFPQQHAPEAINEAFRATAPDMFAQTGWIRTPEDWLFALNPARYEHNHATFLAGLPGWRGEMARPPVGMVDEALKPLSVDPTLTLAEPALGNTRAYTVPWQSGSPLGGFDPDSNSMYVFYGHPNNPHHIPSTTRHETQHVLQHARGAPSWASGSSPNKAVQDNPQLYQQLLGEVQQAIDNGWVNVGPADNVPQQVARELYRMQPGEWEARSAADFHRQWLAQQPLDPFAVGMPDFRVR